MFRRLAELIHPSRKCKRIGHNLKAQRWVIIRSGDFFWRDVATEYVADVDNCTRCSHHSDPRNEKRLRGFTSARFTDHKWDVLNSGGYLFRRLYRPDEQ